MALYLGRPRKNGAYPVLEDERDEPVAWVRLELGLDSFEEFPPADLAGGVRTHVTARVVLVPREGDDDVQR